MKETTALNQISKIVDKLNYKSVYIEIHTKDNKYTFRMFTKFNDLFSVNDISYNRAIELKNNI